MSDSDLGPVLLEQFKAIAPFIGREDMLMISHDASVLDAFAEDEVERGTPGEYHFTRRCPAGHTHVVVGRVFGVSFIVCPMASEGQIWILDGRRMPNARTDIRIEKIGEEP